MCTSLVLVLLAALGPPQGPKLAPPPVPPAPARILVEAGRARVLAAGGLRDHSAGEGELTLTGPVQVEVPPRSRVSVRWAGRSSAQVQGPAGLVWWPGEDGGPDRWQLLGRGRFELEVRSGSVLAELAPGWRGRLEAGAWRVEGLPGGEAVRLLHRAGSPLELHWRGAGGRLLPPEILRQGEAVRLGAVSLPPAALDRAPRVPAWGEEEPFTWPFGAAGHGPDGTHGVPAPPAWERIEWPWPVPIGADPTASAAPAPEPWAPDPKDADTSGRAADGTQPMPQGDLRPPPPGERAPQPEPEPGVGLEPPAPAWPAVHTAPAPHPAGPGDAPAPRAEDPSAPSAPAAPAGRPSGLAEPWWDPGPWRGVPPAERATWWGLVHQRSADLVLELRPDGSRLVLLHPDAPRGIWLFAPGLDLHLAPGAAVVLDSEGKPSARAGHLTVLPATR